MFKFYTLFIFANVLQVIYATQDTSTERTAIEPTPTEPTPTKPILTVLPNSTVLSDAEAEKELAKIEPQDALPLVLFLGYPPTTFKISEAKFSALHLPKDLTFVTTIDRKMVRGTLFANFRFIQVFFCPKPDSTEKCLAPQKFKDSELLKCAIEPIPVIKSNSTNCACGPGNAGTYHNIGYDICPNTAPYEYETEEIIFYGFCFNEDTKKTVFTSHIISSPNLFESSLLVRERNMKYPIIVDDEFKPSNLNEIRIEKILDNEYHSLPHPKKPEYRLQMLVPHRDMNLALWRKTTFRNFNLEWQHKTLIPFWNGMNKYIREHAINLMKSNIKVKVRAGVFEIDPTLQDDVQFFNIWVNLITTVPVSKSVKPQGVVILINNFIRDAAVGKSSSTIPTKIEEAIDGFCPQNICLKGVRETFENVNGRVRCCFLSKDNEKIRELLEVMKDFDTIDKHQIDTLQNDTLQNDKIQIPEIDEHQGIDELHIPGITKLTKNRHKESKSTMKQGNTKQGDQDEKM